MRIIDVHTHVFPDAIAPGAIASLEREGNIRARYDGTVGGLLASMDHACIDVSVIQPVATKASQVASINDWVSTLVGNRLIPFGAMHPDVADPATEMVRMRALGLLGFKMHPEYQQFDPRDERMTPIYDAAEENRMVVFFHAGGDIAFDTVRGTAQAFRHVLEQWPALTVVLAHMGGYRCWDEVSAELLGRNVWLDTAYTLGHLPDDAFVEMVRAHGPHRVLFGSDGPWTDAGAEIPHLHTLGFTDTELEGILGGNAERLLGAHQ